MPFDKQLAQRVRLAIRRRKGFTEKKLFGGIGFLLNGNICVGVWKDLLVIRVGPDNYENVLREPFIRPFDITGKPMRGWAVVEPEGLQAEEDVTEWLEQCTKFVKTLPAK